MHYLRDVLSSGNLTSVVFGTEGGVLWTQSQWQMTWCYWIIKSCDLTCVTPSRIPVAVQKLHCGYKLYIRVNQFSGRQLVCTCSRNISSTCCWELSAGELLERLVFCKLQNKQDSFLIKPTICSNFTNFVLAWNSTCFGQFLCPSSGVYSLYIHQWYVSYKSVDSFRAGPGLNAVCSKAVHKPVWHTPLLSVQWVNSWWWTEELSETCRVSCQNKIFESSASSWFYYKEICYDARSYERKEKWTCLFTVYLYHLYEIHAVVMKICKAKWWRQSVTTRLMLYYYITLMRHVSA